MWFFFHSEACVIGLRRNESSDGDTITNFKLPSQPTPPPRPRGLGADRLTHISIPGVSEKLINTALLPIGRLHSHDIPEIGVFSAFVVWMSPFRPSAASKENACRKENNYVVEQLCLV